MRNSSFQMYDDLPSLMPGTQSPGYKVPVFPTKQIQTPVALMYGGKDTLPDIPYILRNIKKPLMCLNVAEYEHLQFLWGMGQDLVLHPAILNLLDLYSETWADAQDQSTVIESQKMKTAPWIPTKNIMQIRDLNAKLIESDDDFTIKVSVEKSLALNSPVYD